MSISGLSGASPFIALLAQAGGGATGAPVTQPVTVTPVTPPTTSRAVDPELAGVAGVVLLVLTVVGAFLFLRLRTYRSSLVVGPIRVPPSKVWMLLISLGAGTFTWVFGQSLYAGYRLNQLRHAGEPDVANRFEQLLTPRDYAILSTIPPGVAFLLMVVLVSLAGERLADRLGLSLRKLGRGVAIGAMAFIVIFPLVIWCSALVERIYQSRGYRHPGEHELLKTFGEAKAQVAGFILLGATVCAPLFEELLFRGHLQTLLRQFFIWASTPPPAVLAPQGFAPIMPQTLAAEAAPVDPPYMPEVVPTLLPPPPPLAYTNLAPPLVVEEPKLRPWQSWLAIVLTAGVFALVHPLWMSPLIFVLAVGLGYVYERTGILWASITVHLLFNSVETLQYYLFYVRH